MKVCDCVKDAVWYDPRVRKQIDEYLMNYDLSDELAEELLEYIKTL